MKTGTTHKIEISNITEEAEEFKTYLEKLGHSVTIGHSTGTYVDGWNSDNEECPLDMDRMWSDYCNS